MDIQNTSTLTGEKLKIKFSSLKLTRPPDEFVIFDTRPKDFIVVSDDLTTANMDPCDSIPVYNNGTHNYTTITTVIYPASDTIPDGQLIANEGGMNVLGLVVFSIVFGIVLSRMGEKGAPLKAFFETLNEVVMKMVTLVMWYVLKVRTGLLVQKYT